MQVLAFDAQANLPVHSWIMSNVDFSCPVEQLFWTVEQSLFNRKAIFNYALYLQPLQFRKANLQQYSEIDSFPSHPLAVFTNTSV